MDEGTKAIIKDISREIADNQLEKWEKTLQLNNEYLDGKFLCIETKINEIKVIVDDMSVNGCKQCIDHVKFHKEKEKRMVRTITLVSTIIPTAILLGNWVKGIIIIWWKSGTKGS